MKESPNEGDLQINRYLIERVRKLEAKCERLEQRNAALRNFLEEYREQYAEQADESAAYFALIDSEPDQ